MLKNIALAVIISTAMIRPATAQRYLPLPKPATGWDLGYELERRFADYAYDCKLGKPLTMTKNGIVGKNPRAVSSVDADIIAKLSLDAGHPIQKPADIWLGRLFGYVYKDGEGDNPQWLQKQFLPVNYEDDKEMLPLFGFDAAEYSSNCGSILKSALKSGTDFSFPVATIKAGLEAEYDNTTKSLLRLSYGTFASPILAMWNPVATDVSGRSRKRFFVSMLMWDWYNRALPSGKYYLLSSFNGGALYLQTTTNMDGNASGSISARVGLPFLTGDGSVQATIDRERSLKISKFSVFVNAATAGSPPPKQWEEVPSIDTVLDAIRKNANVSKPSLAVDMPISSGQDRIFTVNVDALPAAYCDKVWQIRDTVGETKTSTTTALDEINRIPGTTLCRLTLRYTAGTVQTGKDIVLTPQLVSNDDYAGKRLSLPLGRLVLKTTDLPKLTPVTVNPRSEKPIRIPGSDPARYTLAWKLDFKMQDNNQYGDLNRIQTASLGLSLDDCGGALTAGDATFTPELVGAATMGTRTLRLNGTAVFQGGDIGENYEYVACHISGQIVFLPPDGSLALERSVPNSVVVYYPKRIKPVPAPAPAPPVP